MPKSQATTMSVPEMRELLGLRKTESYWLVHKNVFTTVVIAGQMRIVNESFENWYENQIHYRKVNGPEPGKQLRQQSYTICEAAEILGIHKESFRQMVYRHGIETFVLDNQQRIERSVFDSWYASQSHYRNTRDRTLDKELKDCSISVPEIGRMLAIDRIEAWKIVNQHKKELKMIRVADRPRVTLESFEQWYASQHIYTKVSEMDAETQKQIALQQQQNTVHQMVKKGKKTLSIYETAVYLGMSVKTVRGLACDEPSFGAKKIGGVWYISLEKLNEWTLANGNKYTFPGLIGGHENGNNCCEK